MPVNRSSASVLQTEMPGTRLYLKTLDILLCDLLVTTLEFIQISNTRPKDLRKNFWEGKIILKKKEKTFS